MNKITIPREVEKWLQTLDLSYKISNAKRYPIFFNKTYLSRDLCNGFLVAEILSRFPKIFKGERHEYDIRSFSTGLSMDERKANWSHLKKLFDYNKIPFSDDLIPRVYNQAPNAAFELLIGIYKYVTNKE